jgi:hypothetical protein
METEVSVLLQAALNGHTALCSRVVVQGDHKVSVHLMISVQNKYAKIF